MNALPRILLGMLSAVALAVGLIALLAPSYRATRPLPPRNPVPERAFLPGPAADSLARVVLARAPFRFSRTPSMVAYHPDGVVTHRVEQLAAPKPQLTLAGVVWEPTATAVIEGFPGAGEATVVREGQTVGALKVKRIERNRVVITGMDTTWMLSVKEPWK